MISTILSSISLKLLGLKLAATGFVTLLSGGGSNPWDDGYEPPNPLPNP